MKRFFSMDARVKPAHDESRARGSPISDRPPACHVERAAQRWREQEFCAPPGAEQQRGPEHVAGHGIPEKRQRRDVAMNETMEIMRVHAAERPDRKVRRGKEE